MPGYRPSSCIGWLWIETASDSVNTWKPHLANSVRQSQSRIRFTFLAHGARHVLKKCFGQASYSYTAGSAVSLFVRPTFCLPVGFLYLSAVSYQELGCFKDKAKDRAMGNMLKSFRKFIDWRDMSKTVKNCSDVARSRKWVDLTKVMLVKDGVY